MDDDEQPRILAMRFEAGPDTHDRLQRAIIMATDAAIGHLLTVGHRREQIEIVPAHDCHDPWVMGKLRLNGKPVWHIVMTPSPTALHLRAEWLRDDLRPWWKRLLTFWKS